MLLSYVIIQNRQKKFYDLGVHTTRPIKSERNCRIKVKTGE